jgi:hypothetical protein
MSDGDMRQNVCPYFREFQERVRNNDIGEKDPWQFVKHVRFEHESHPSNTHPTVLNPLKYSADVTNCEISDL